MCSATVSNNFKECNFNPMVASVARGVESRAAVAACDLFILRDLLRVL